MKENNQKPDLLKQNDIISFYHIQVPQWLFADKRYNRISLAAKMAYSLLLNRHQLSKLHGWINKNGEVYIIYPRDELAEILQVGSKKVISIFRELVNIGLVWEKRRGNNRPNHIYLTRVILSDKDAAAYDNAPFVPSLYTEDEVESGGAEFACPNNAEQSESLYDAEKITPHEIFRHAKMTVPDAQKTQFITRGNRTSGGVESAGLDVQKPHPSYIYSSQNEISHTEISQSVRHARPREESDRRTDDEIAELDEILDGCELWAFSENTAKVFGNAIERLFFSESYRIAGCVLPQKKVRSHLHELDLIKLQTAEAKISRNTEKEIRNTTAYTMAVIFNSIWETESDVMADPYLNSLRIEAPPGDKGGMP